MGKLLSIAIPTLNRQEYLQFTLDSFIPQMEKFKDEAELVVCNNASDDKTSEIVSEYERKFDFIRFNDCKNRVALGDSFKRTIAFSKGKYVILWGDDDIPAPFLIGYLLQLIKDNPQWELYYFNRLMGYEDGCPIKSLMPFENRYEELRTVYTDSTKFIEENFSGAAFMSAVMFSRAVWDRGLAFDTSSHYGFEYIGIFYYGNKGKEFVRENYPLCIQRKVVKRAWSTDWAKYALLGLPNMSKDLEAEGIYKNGLDTWNKKYNKFIMYCYTLMCASTEKKKYRPYCKEFIKYQKGLIRKIMCYAIIYCMPEFVYNFSRVILFHIKK